MLIDTSETSALESRLKQYGFGKIFSEPEAVRPYLRMRRFRAGETLWLAEAFPDSLLFFTAGRVKVYGQLETGDRVLLRECRPLMLMGEAELRRKLLAAGERGGMENDLVCLETETACEAVELYYAPIQRELMNDPVFLRMLLNSASEKLEFFGTLQISNTLQRSDARLAEYMLGMADREGSFTESQSVTAELLHISYRHLHRILKKWIEYGCVERIRGGYRITNPEALRNCISPPEDSYD